MPDKQALTPERFADFYRELHGGRRPYRWQERAAGELATGRIRPALFAPTGAGKTTLIECFLFALACTADEHGRTLPLRLFWVIDRRSVADQVHRHAESVASAIKNGKHGVLESVRERLSELAGEHSRGDEGTIDPVHVRLWRGGLTGEAAGNAHAPLPPCAPAVICTTVDQIGSRMLFRGYGVARGSRPVEAALSATDSLIALDEAHLSGPFRQTAEAIRRAQRLIDERPVRPLHVMRISATPDESDRKAFELTAGELDALAARTAADESDKKAFELTEEELAEPALARRFEVSKPVDLSTGKDQVRRCAAEARRLASERTKVVAVVVNTVAAARSIYTALCSYGDAVLLIGPVRPLDRQGLLERIPPREEREQRRRPLFVVGTQTIEVGVDLDFDALVTACAPFPSLAQRFGRLDRRGDMEGAGRGVIVEPPKDCPVYGEATARTWEWLREVSAGEPLDLGPAAIERLRKKSPPPDPPDPPQAPILGPWHVERLLQTSHTPEPDPDVAVFLHGEQALDNADVQICWRVNLGQSSDTLAEQVKARPPHPGELLSLSPGAARRWLRRQEAADDLSDVESLPSTDANDSTQGRWALRVRPPEADGVIETSPIPTGQLRPGDLIVVPADYGGCDAFGWAPESRRPVHDLGNLAINRPRILLSDSPAAPEELRLPEALRGVAQETLDRLDSEEWSEEEAYEALLPGVVSWLKSGGGFDTESFPGAAEATNKLADRLDRAAAATTPRRGRARRMGTAPDTGECLGELLIVAPPSLARTYSRKPVSYEKHADAVTARALSFARSLGLPAKLVRTIGVAARNHDAGKLDWRFQTWLNDGVPIDGHRPLAKSGHDPGGPRSRRARILAGWPQGKRHESISAALIAHVQEWPGEILLDLLIHLVSAHHGDGRPFRIAADDPNPVEVRAEITLDPSNGECAEAVVRSDREIPWPEHVERFVALNERFGPWGLAALETILVLADRGVSAEEGQ